MKEASGVASSSLTPSCSQTISLTLASTDDAIVFTSYFFFFLTSHKDSAEKPPIKPVCHSEQSEESRVFQDLRPFTSFRVTFRGHSSAESYSETLGDLTIRRPYLSSTVLKSFRPGLPPL